MTSRLRPAFRNHRCRAPSILPEGTANVYYEASAFIVTLIQFLLLEKRVHYGS